MDVFEHYIYYLIGSRKKDHLTIVAGTVYSSIYQTEGVSINIPFMYRHSIELKSENASMLFEMLRSDNKETKQLAIETFKQEAYAQEQSKKESQKENI